MIIKPLKDELSKTELVDASIEALGHVDYVVVYFKGMINPITIGGHVTSYDKETGTVKIAGVILQVKSPILFRRGFCVLRLDNLNLSPENGATFVMAKDSFEVTIPNMPISEHVNTGFVKIESIGYGLYDHKENNEFSPMCNIDLSVYHGSGQSVFTIEYAFNIDSTNELSDAAQTLICHSEKIDCGHMIYN